MSFSKDLRDLGKSLLDVGGAVIDLAIDSVEEALKEHQRGDLNLLDQEATPAEIASDIEAKLLRSRALTAQLIDSLTIPEFDGTECEGPGEELWKDDMSVYTKMLEQAGIEYTTATFTRDDIEYMEVSVPQGYYNSASTYFKWDGKLHAVGTFK